MVHEHVNISHEISNHHIVGEGVATHAAGNHGLQENRKLANQHHA